MIASMTELREVNVYSVGLCHCSVCAPADMSRKDVEAMVNYLNPTGIQSKWVIDLSPTFLDGSENGRLQTCEGVPTRHWLMVS